MSWEKQSWHSHRQGRFRSPASHCTSNGWEHQEKVPMRSESLGPFLWEEAVLHVNRSQTTASFKVITSTVNEACFLFRHDRQSFSLF